VNLTPHIQQSSQQVSFTRLPCTEEIGNRESLFINGTLFLVIEPMSI